MESRQVDSASISSFDLSGKLDKAEDEITVSAFYFTWLSDYEEGSKIRHVFNKLQ